MKRWLIAISGTCLLFSGCTKAEKKERQPATAIETPQKEPENETGQQQVLSPLTGLPAKQDANHRVVGVMINNHPAARPQSGLQKADVVYEVLAEGDITRFLALYQSEFPEKVGPVRSARDYYIELSKGFDALYICHGWSPEAKSMLEAGGTDYLNGLFYDGTLFKRASFRKAPHNSYITFANIEKGAKEKGYSLEETVEALPFFKNEAQSEPAEQVDISYSKRSYAHVQYQYISDKKGYIRYSGGEQTIDYDTHDPILVQNVFIVAAVHTIADEYGRRDIDLTSGGDGYLFQNGTVKRVEWKNVNGRLLPYDHGVPVGFTPGKTWINVVPSLDMVQYR
ncbi:putative lipoprotein yerB [Anoxybacillus sp. B7M1]|uniref:DUF3048 domain-containing protein n=1 Tax=Anoxybacteroides rupiense TaxID=311460 RepID=A0ABT5W2E0_9BACL|nr:MULTISPECIES: DUF3048 domain-containing protein [Anoxybacillus]ANB59103.1 putative lipoprotein yerB [Anoxybacillus sp. B2M1]ANB65709.1 putative lipoprotein yerB [Anoxybacillus sp. B7M1]KXG09865.1 putative lipoprotein YerB [Anoxybacillus sp. P3H1B]MBB3907721.1 hypothetical protein [Anoxybacillus rupiensis]MBS2772120.1 DUF3048 domain-containing protein [Anoxybacillus rupiensis]